MANYQKLAEDLLQDTHIKVNGPNPWDPQIKNIQLYKRIFSQGTLGLGEAYMDNWWEAKKLDQFFSHVLSANLKDKITKNWRTLLLVVKNVLFNTQRFSRAFNIGQAHYDIGNDLYQIMLDKRLVYTCGYWAQADNLDQAQEAKLDLVCKKIGLKAGQKVLDIGCGWGSWAKFAAEKYGAQVVGITVSKEQVELGNKLCQGLPVEIRLQDYRDVREKFDHIISLGMFEHVGYKNYRQYMQMVANNLKDNGLFLLHTIGGNKSSRSGDPWIDKYIFPDGMLPSIKQIATASEDLFIMEDWHNFGADYDKTLMAWFHNFSSGWDQIKSKYGNRFYRMWKYYLLSCAALFRTRQIQLWQVVLSKHGVNGGYKSVR